MTTFMSRVRARRSGARDEGAAAIEAAILAPAILLILGLGIGAMRIEVAGEAVDSSAHDAARAASISRNGTDAQAAATTAARNTLAAAAPDLSDPDRDGRHERFRPADRPTRLGGGDRDVRGRPVRRGARGHARHKTMTSTFTSVIDQYGGRS